MNLRNKDNGSKDVKRVTTSVKMLRGVNVLADAVSYPRSESVARSSDNSENSDHQQRWRFRCREIDQDKSETWAQMVKEGSKANDAAGDGTTTATNTQAIIEGLKAAAA